jgi:hypothetical protein
MKGYKVFNPDLTCRGFQYEIGKTYHHEGEVIPCISGFHFCEKADDCFNYYPFDSSNIVCEVEASGKVVYHTDKHVTDTLTIGRQLSWHEVLDLVNTGMGNIGLKNSGDYNTGGYNSGDYNTGDSNTGHHNSGSNNPGNHNSGYRNDGEHNSGYFNSGDYNTGNHNSGNYNSGNYNSGNWNTGIYNSGYNNTGNYNSKNNNTGNHNSGDKNSGFSNSGNYNTGNHNSGNFNSGEYNTGDYNSGNYNTGNYNTGYYNSTDFSSGIFNNKPNKLYIFNKPTDITITDWLNSDTSEILSRLNKKQTTSITNEVTYKEAWGELWESLTVEEKILIQEIPNFDKEVFFDITGIEIN